MANQFRAVGFAYRQASSEDDATESLQGVFKDAKAFAAKHNLYNPDPKHCSGNRVEADMPGDYRDYGFCIRFQSASAVNRKDYNYLEDKFLEFAKEHKLVELFVGSKEDEEVFRRKANSSPVS